MCACESNPNVEKARELFQRSIEGPYGLRDMSDYSKMIEEGYTQDEYYKFAKIFDDGIVKDEELNSLAAENRYHEDFLNEFKRLRGRDSSEALRKRVAWLGDNCVKKAYRFDYPPENRVVMVDKLADLFRAEGVGYTEQEYIISSLFLASCNYQSMVYFNDDNDVGYEAAIDALAKIGPDVIPALTIVLNEGDRVENNSAAKVLGKIGPPAIPALIAALENGDSWYIRGFAATALGEIVPTSGDVSSALADAVSGDTSPVVRENATDALKKIQDRKIQNTSGNI